MQTPVEQGQSDLQTKVLTMASHAEAAVVNAIKAVVERNDSLAQKVEEDDKILDQFEREIDETAIQLLLKAPLASHLRFITVTMKVSQNLERIGDEATKIARCARELNNEPQLKAWVDIPTMAKLVLGMLKTGMDSFVERAPDKARAVIPLDQEVDLLNKQLHRELTSYIIENQTAITRCLNLMVISKSLERIADHVKNVAEEVVYLCDAQDIRHQG